MKLNKLFSRKKSNNKNSNQEVASEVCAGEITMEQSTRSELTNKIENVDNLINISKEVVIQMDMMSSDIATTIGEIASGAVTQEIDSQKCAELIQDLSGKINEVDATLVKVISLIKETRENTNKSNDRIEELKTNTHDFKQYFGEVGSKVTALNDSTNEITNITEAILSISKQTNLLSLNASIEAARAGEAGKGFAVVAEEVRKLAVQSNTLTENISKVVSSINENIEETFEIVRKSEEIFRRQESSVEDTEASFEAIQHSMGIVENSVQNVNEKINEMNISKEKVVTSIESISAVASESAAATEEIKASIDDQHAITSELLTSTNELVENMQSLKSLLQ